MSSALTRPELDLLRALDRWRGALIRSMGPVGRTLASRRDLRVAAMGVGSVASAVVLATALPVWMAILGPATLGIAHLVADVRYLVLRPGLHRDPAFWRTVGAPVALALLVAHPAMGLLAIAGGAALGGGPVARRAGVAAIGLGAVLWALGDPVAATGALAQLHNPFAIALWWAWAPRRPVHAAPVVAYALGSAALLSGALDLPLAAGLARSPDGAWEAIRWLGLGADGPWELRLVAWASFGQMVHYGMWLRCIPEDDRPRESARSLRRQLQELVDDIGVGGVAATVLLTVALVALVPIAPLLARDAYFVLAPFHPYLEFGVAAFWLAGARRS